MGARIAIITGAGRGIGKAIAVTLARKGAFPVIVDIDKDAADKTVAELKAEGLDAAAFKVDVSNVGQIKTLVDEVHRRYGSVDILVNNAGVLSKASLEDLDEAEWDRVMNINVKSAVFFMKYVTGYMKTAGWGRIVTISSLAGQMGGYATGCAYSTSKAALLGMTMCIARKVAPFGITVNAVAPGMVRTEMVADKLAANLPYYLSRIPVNRIAEPADIANAVTFLASAASDYMTGTTLDLTGGLLMR